MSDKQEEPETPGVLDPNVDAGLTREALYELVWSEPMLKVAAQFGVSSSYMARVCTRLYVPRPERGDSLLPARFECRLVLILRIGYPIVRQAWSFDSS